MFEKYIYNRYLKEDKLIKASSPEKLDEKVKKQKEQWKEKERLEKMKQEAIYLTRQAMELHHQYKNLLVNTVYESHVLDWDELYDHSTFNREEPTLHSFMQQSDIPEENKFLEFFFSSVKEKREEKIRDAESAFQEILREYTNEKNAFYSEKNRLNKSVDEYREAFEKGNTLEIEKYFTKVLENSPYPQEFVKKFELQYSSESKSLIVEYSLPAIDQIPTITEYKYIQTRKEINAKKLSKKELQSFYDSTLYQIALRTIYECFISDYPHHIDIVTFNGWVQGVDSATGHDFNSCILSLSAGKEEFLKLDLKRVIPKDCFLMLKGISAGPLHQIAPVRPIMELNRNDKRFVETNEVLAEINSIPNLAEMDWKDFEHLIVQLFELHFKKVGGEVKVTQATKEGGVDGVIFDPDEISGGKYIIQAKRYNHVVPPAAVRELNGVMVDEGAAKGILVTTSYFGRDSIDFVKNKPITLIDGQRLVHMLSKHGHSVRVEIKKKNRETS